MLRKLHSYIQFGHVACWPGFVREYLHTEVLGWELPTSPKLALLHVANEIRGNKYKRNLLFLGLTIAKRDIARL